MAVLALLLGVFAGLRGNDPPAVPRMQAATVLPTPRPLTGLALTGDDGQAFTEQQLRGQWTFVFIGYTHCPDVCPATMLVFQVIAKALGEAPATSGLPRFLMVSVDPRRDTPEKLRQYVRHFHPDFRAATGDDAALGALTRQLGGVYLRHDEGRQEGYLVDHSAAIWLLNPRAEYHALFTAPQDPLKLAHDFRLLAATDKP
jgi:protein SCO1/2